MVENNNQEASFGTTEENRFVNEKRSNVKSDLIEITEDKLENILLKHLKKMGTRTSWLAPLGLFISVMLANISADFSEKYGVPASTWEALFILAAIGSAVWLVVSLIAMCIYWQESSTDYLINQIKASEKQ